MPGSGDDAPRPDAPLSPKAREIKRRIEDGSYEIDYDGLAGALVDEVTGAAGDDDTTGDAAAGGDGADDEPAGDDAPGDDAAR